MNTAQGMLVSEHTELALYQSLNLRCKVQQVKQRMTRWQQPYLELILAVGGNLIRSCVWKPSLINRSQHIEAGREYNCQLRLRRFNGEIRGDISCVAEADSLALSERVVSRLLSTEQINELNEWLRDCPLSTLRQFVLNVFSDEQIAEAFFTRPASREHHHCWQGGLAEHSLEVAHGVLRALSPDEDQQIAWLTSCAGIFHDIGKARTHRNDGMYTPLGHTLDHDSMTLEILAPALKTLERTWSEGANALRYLLTLKSRPAHAKRLLIPAGIILLEQDRYSAGYSAPT